MAGRVEGKIAHITGAGLGLGQAAARLLAAEGASVRRGRKWWSMVGI
jgi:NADP-dependent 3-hydroxy acid dehydrogenase YdfG